MTIATSLSSFGVFVVLATGAMAQAPPPDPVVEHTAPVTLDGETLYYVHEFMGILSPEDRAAAISRKLKLLADDPFYSPKLFSSEDVAASGASSAEIANERIRAITNAIATTILVLLLLGLRRGWVWSRVRRSSSGSGPCAS